MRWWEWGWGRDLRIRSGRELAWPLRQGPRSPLAPAVASCWDARGAHMTLGTTPNFAGPCGYSKEGGDGETDSDQLHWSHRMWMELAGRGRGGGIFRSLRSRALGRRLVAAGRGSSLLTSTHGAIHGRPPKAVNILCVLVPRARLSSIPTETQKRLFPRTF